MASERFRKGQRVQVVEDFGDRRFNERLGTVAKVSDDKDEIYPRGRVAVVLVYDELVSKLFGNGGPPSPVWFKPNDLEKL